MQVKTLYEPHERISIDTYLQKCGVQDIAEFISGGASGVEPCENYDNMQAGFDMLNQANGLVYILIDVDGDGYYSGAIMYQYLKQYNPSLDVKPLFHIKRVHGLNEQYIMDTLLKDKPSLVICPDSSTNDTEQCKVLKENGINVLVLDHHPQSIDNPYAVVINNKTSDRVVNKDGSGGLVTWKFCKYCDTRTGGKFASTLIDLVYFSLLSDICKMNTLENRAFAHWGRNVKNKLLKAMCDDLLKSKPVNNHNISWTVQPKISDIIKCDNQELKEALFYALATEEHEHIARVVDCCLQVNKQRRKYVEEYFNNMGDIDEGNNIIFEKVEGLYSYYTGLVASKFNDKYNKPCILYREPYNGKIIGSVRSPYPIKQQLIESGVFDNVAGHDSACGCQFDVANIDKVAQFVKDVQVDIRLSVTESFNGEVPIPPYLFQCFEPYVDLFGQGVPKPQFHVYNIKINSSKIQVMGSAKTTLKFVYNGITYIKFFVSHEAQEKLYRIGENRDLLIEVIGNFETNHFRGSMSPQVTINKIEVNVRDNSSVSIDDLF